MTTAGKNRRSWQLPWGDAKNIRRGLRNASRRPRSVRLAPCVSPFTARRLPFAACSPLRTARGDPFPLLSSRIRPYRLLFYLFGTSRNVFLIYYKRSELPESIFYIATNARNFPKDRKQIYHIFGKFRSIKNMNSNYSEESEKFEIRYTSFRVSPIDIDTYFYSFGDFRRAESIYISLFGDSRELGTYYKYASE